MKNVLVLALAIAGTWSTAFASAPERVAEADMQAYKTAVNQRIGQLNCGERDLSYYHTNDDLIKTNVTGANEVWIDRSGAQPVITFIKGSATQRTVVQITSPDRNTISGLTFVLQRLQDVDSSNDILNPQVSKQWVNQSTPESCVPAN